MRRPRKLGELPRQDSMLTIAIGDIHGMAGKLEALLRKIDAWFRERHESDAPRFIFLGDYIDRGPNSREVIERVRVLQEKGAVCLRGNHEELMIQSTESEARASNLPQQRGRRDDEVPANDRRLL